MGLLFVLFVLFVLVSFRFLSARSLLGSFNIYIPFILLNCVCAYDTYDAVCFNLANSKKKHEKIGDLLHSTPIIVIGDTWFFSLYGFLVRAHIVLGGKKCRNWTNKNEEVFFRNKKTFYSSKRGFVVILTFLSDIHKY